MDKFQSINDNKPLKFRRYDRKFYSRTSAFGRFGMRTFTPMEMDIAHWHGHIEANFITGGTAVYLFDNNVVEIPANTLTLFWAGIPHQLIEKREDSPGSLQTINMYIPLDQFLLMPNIAQMQIAALGGGVISIPQMLHPKATLMQWYDDYRTGIFERSELVNMEINALLRRASLNALYFIHKPSNSLGQEKSLASSHIKHVIAMLRFVLENLDQPLSNQDVTKVTRLSTNYALDLFSETVHTPLKQFIIRMRLLRARAMLLESQQAIATIATDCGFMSISQFYHHFDKNYGISPSAMRAQYLQEGAESHECKLEDIRLKY